MTSTLAPTAAGNAANATAASNATIPPSQPAPAATAAPAPAAATAGPAPAAATGAPPHPDAHHPVKHHIHGKSLQYHLLDVFALFCFPWFAFATVSLVFSFSCFYPNVVSMLVVFVLVLVCGLLTIMEKWGPPYQYNGYLGLVAVVLGVVVGEYTYGAFTAQWWSLAHRTPYTNVVPTESAFSKADGGLVEFVEGTHVDTRRSLGHMTFDRHVYCVAPILNDEEIGRANFWAIGKDCCESFWGFNCGEVLDPAARSGVVYFNAQSVFGQADFPRFQDAAKQAAAFYGMWTPEEPVLVTWVADPDMYRDTLMIEGRMWLATVIGIYLLGSLVLAVIIHFFLNRKRLQHIQ